MDRSPKPFQPLSEDDRRRVLDLLKKDQEEEALRQSLLMAHHQPDQQGQQQESRGEPQPLPQAGQTMPLVKRRSMNRHQNLVILIGTILIALMGLFPPWRVDRVVTIGPLIEQPAGYALEAVAKPGSDH